MNLGQLYNDLLFRLGKDQYGGYVTPANFPEILNTIVQANYMIAEVRKFEETREISMALRPFIKTLGAPGFAPLTLTPWGTASKFCSAVFPSDMWYQVRASWTEFFQTCSEVTDIEYRDIRWVSQDEWQYRTTSKLFFPVASRPIATSDNEKIIVCPVLPRMSFTYIRTYANVVFDYEIVSGNTVLYLPPGSVHTNNTTAPAGTPSSSVELEWPDSEHLEMLNRLEEEYRRNISNRIEMVPHQKP